MNLSELEKMFLAVKENPNTDFMMVIGESVCRVYPFTAGHLFYFHFEKIGSFPKDSKRIRALRTILNRKDVEI